MDNKKNAKIFFICRKFPIFANDLLNLSLTLQINMKIYVFLVILISFTTLLIACTHQRDENHFINQIDELEDNPKWALAQIDTFGLQHIRTFDEATRYLMKSLAEHYIRQEDWPDEDRINQCIRVFRNTRAYEPLLEALCLVSNMYEYKGQNDKQVESMEEAITLAKEKKDNAWLFFLFDNLSYMYLKQYNALKYFKYQTLAYECIKNKAISTFNVSSQIAIGKNYMYTGKSNEAIAVLKSVETTLTPNHIYYTDCKLWLGAAYIKEKRWEKGIREIEEALPYIENEPNRTIANTFLTITYSIRGDIVKSEHYLKEIDIDRLLIPDYRIKKELYKSQAQIAYLKQDYAGAVAYLQRLHSLDEEVISNLNTKTLDEVIFHYRMEKEQLLKAKNDKRLYSLIVFLIVGIGLMARWYLAKKRKYKRIRWELEQRLEILQGIADEKESIKNELTKFIVRDFEIAKKIALLKNTQHDTNRIFVSKLDKLLVTEDNKLLQLKWDKFYEEIDFYKQDFHKKLIAAFPLLIEKEVQLCCLLIIGFNTHEIAAIWSQSIYSVHKYKTSIRKKTGLSEGADIATELLTRFTTCLASDA